MKPIPILVLSDGPEQLTGLARVGRDIAGLLATMPEFRVGYLGRASVGRLKFPWTTYSYPESAGWGEQYLASVWSDFSGGERGIVWSNWDASRMLWLARPEGLPDNLANAYDADCTFQKWGYFPFDATGPDGVSLPVGMREVVAGFDRVCATSEWGYGLAMQVRPDADWLPHGIWMDKFKPMGKAEARKLLGWDECTATIGCNMANQARKNWPAAFEAARILRDKYTGIRFWVHCDETVRYWNIFALATDYGIARYIDFTHDLTDEQLALRYSACDATMVPSDGEGFGYPIAESMACGTPCVVTDYAAGQELVDEACKVRPVTYRVDTIHNVRRACVNGHAFAAAMYGQIERKRDDEIGTRERMVERVGHLGWDRLRSTWERWFRDGLRGLDV